jgi:hypothetical protein
MSPLTLEDQVPADLAICGSQFFCQGEHVYELILTVMVTFVGPVAEVDGHGISMLSQRYEVAVQGFSSQEACSSFAGYTSLESYLTGAFGAQTKVSN